MRGTRRREIRGLLLPPSSSGPPRRVARVVAGEEDPETGQRRRSAVGGRNRYRARRRAWRISRVVSSGTESASVGNGGNEETRTVADVDVDGAIIRREMMVDGEQQAVFWS